MSDLSKADALLHKTHSKVLLVLRYQGSTCVDRNIIKSLSKITHQIWCNHPFRPIQPKRHDHKKSSGSGGWRRWKIWKWRGRQYRESLHKIGGLGALRQQWRNIKLWVIKGWRAYGSTMGIPFGVMTALWFLFFLCAK